MMTRLSQRQICTSYVCQRTYGNHKGLVWIETTRTAGLGYKAQGTNDKKDFNGWQ